MNNTAIMKALSIRQPWAWLIVHGYKDIENRTWMTRHRGPLFIHASLRDDPAGYAFARVRGIVVPTDLPHGGIVGRVELQNCVSAHGSPWFEGPYGFILRHAEPLLFQPRRGQVGLFQI